MPYAQPSTGMLPFASGSDTSHEAARAAAVSAVTQRELLTRWYMRCGQGLTDAEMSRLSGLPVNVICARRNELKAVKMGKRRGPHGVLVTVWTLEVGR